MALEIERKFLVKSDEYKKGRKTHIIQAYVAITEENITRVRIHDEKGYITIKGMKNSIQRLEYEYEIPKIEAEEIIEKICIKSVIEKYRYLYLYENKTWEIDEFLGDNEGLVVAEIELNSISEKIIKPKWIGDEVSHDIRFYNFSLFKNPYKNWK